ncbi:hypothetical protein PY650_00955 [Rhizobium calliandrae]|uniref:Uncharacterized protein n=1 Tax=Rhizobium calliandrae TaxID=1312182 RepID=A0ABT7K6L7_9HYPH|nr:hypothetical protein [Rhizobium calliandrae]MDL2404245.1 hypothetical protein [Rhizobium calliandrae]
MAIDLGEIALDLFRDEIDAHARTVDDIEEAVPDDHLRQPFVPPHWLPNAPTIANCITVMFKSNIPRYFMNSVITSVGLTVLAFILAIFAYWGLILVYMISALALSVWMLTSYVKAIPIELEERRSSMAPRASASPFASPCRSRYRGWWWCLFMSSSPPGTSSSSGSALRPTVR